MRLFKLRTNINNRLISVMDSPKTFFVVFLLILIALSVPLVKNIGNRRRINQEIKSLEAEIKLTDSKNNDLNKLISYLESDQYLEEQARLNMGLKKDGEEVVVLKGLNKTEENGTEGKLAAADSPYSIPGLANENQKNIDSNPAKWVRYFIK